MIVLVAVGMMNVAVMAALAVVIFVEKLWRYGNLFGQTIRVLLVTIGVLAIWLGDCFLACMLRHAGDVRQAGSAISERPATPGRPAHSVGRPAHRPGNARNAGHAAHTRRRSSYRWPRKPPAAAR